MLIQRVTDTAKLAGITGSCADRMKIAKQLRAQFSKLAEDKFEKQGFVTQAEIEGFYKKLMPNLDLEVVNLPKNADYQGQCDFKYNLDKKSISGYRMELPFSETENIIKKDESKYIKTMTHEEEHSILYATQPKYAIKWTKGKLSTEKFDLQSDKYGDFIYNNETKLSSVHNKKYLRSSEPARINFIKKDLSSFFNKNSFTPEEKIDTLQRWRHYIREEMTAYKAGTSAFVNKKFPIKALSADLKKRKSLTLNSTFNAGKKLSNSTQKNMKRWKKKYMV